MTALAEAGIETPRVVPTVDGEPFAVLRTSDGHALQLDLFEWVNGEQLGSVESGLGNEGAIGTTYRTIGELAARLHNQAERWSPPAGFMRPAWDESGLAGEKPLWGRFWELGHLTAGQRKLMRAARERVYDDLGALGKSPAEYSMIHADFTPENILVDEGRLRLIDFDDSGFGWHLFELVTSLYFITGEPYFEEARDALIAGYREHRSLPEERLRLLPLFFLARGLTYVGWVHTRPNTDTARQMTPMLVEGCCGLAEAYLGSPPVESLELR
jgi:Ser/Thr protein kinase RdoA (MazF antagonist)